MKIPKVSSDQMRQVDAHMLHYQITLIQMMENAGRNLATLARMRFLKGDVLNKKVFVFAGTGGNGGGGLVAARFLFNWGAYVNVFLTKPVEELEGITKQQALSLENMGIPLDLPSTLIDKGTTIDADIILDAIIGYSLKGKPQGTAASLIEYANSTSVPILSLDLPSGLDATTGEAYGDLTIHATATMTLGIPKIGLFYEKAKNYVGDLYLADICIPLELYKDLGIEMPERGIFHNGSIVKLKKSMLL